MKRREGEEGEEEGEEEEFHTGVLHIVQNNKTLLHDQCRQLLLHYSNGLYKPLGHQNKLLHISSTHCIVIAFRFQGLVGFMNCSASNLCLKLCEMFFQGRHEIHTPHSESQQLLYIPET